MKKAQVANEFIILFGFAVLVLMIFLYVMIDEVRSIQSEKELEAIRDVGFFVQNELFIASIVNDGYYREFEIPILHQSLEYSININNNMLILVSQRNDIEQYFLIPKVEGNVTKGLNNISKIGGVIHLN
jgi:uncharacterized protein (UPF0333 family)